jgi:hypothetical protein
LLGIKYNKIEKYSSVRGVKEIWFNNVSIIELK